MGYKHTVEELLNDHLKLFQQKINGYLEQISNLTARINELLAQVSYQSAQIKELKSKLASREESLHSLEGTLTEKDDAMNKLINQNRGLSHLVSKPSEKISPPSSTEARQKNKAPSPKERGNNNAKRKEYFDLETVYEDVYPDTPDFNMKKAHLLSSKESIRYEFIPPRFIKHIYRLHTYRYEGVPYSPKAPRAPLMNSLYDSSFIAAMIQLRYIYSLPVERIVKYFAENNFDVNKGTANGLLGKAAELMEPLGRVLHKVILEAPYLSMDETYYTILIREKGENGKGTRKGYIWAALDYMQNLIHYFYDEGSRGRHVLTDYIPNDYKGAIQSDGYIDYAIIETGAFPDVIRLGCFQHCKRKFINIMENSEKARQVIDIMNELYQLDHKVDKDWDTQRKMEYRKERGSPIMDRLKDKLLQIVSDPEALPSSDLLVQAANYTLGQFDALSNCLLGDYKLDNNAIERAMRPISLSRRNSLFAGSHKGAENHALFYSLACSCQMQNINSFEYFNDVLKQLAYINPNAPDEVFIELLPHKWKERHPKSKTEELAS
jgi:uncharacterized coiled-coil protein SlyX